MESKIEEILARGTVVEVLPSKEEFVRKLTAGEKFRIYFGIDPTFTAIHLGHAKSIMFLEDLRQLGAEVILLFGDFTAQIGDPTDKGSTRTQLSSEQVQANMKTWLEQIRPILNLTDKNNPAKVMYNSDWLGKLNFSEILNIASNFTVQQMIERDMFEKRIKEGNPIHLHEFMYPLMQGYDSVAMDVDAELCGTDQIFNALAGRTLLKRLKNKEKLVVALNMLSNPKTGELMSKSKGTGVFINLPASELYGSIMSLPDPMIEPLFINCTRIPLNEKESIMSLGPRDAKARVAFDIVKRFHGDDKAKEAESSFNNTFAKGQLPDDIQEVLLKDGDSLADILVKNNVVESKTDWRRLVTDGAIRLENDEKVSDPNFKPSQTTILKIGKRRFVRIVV